MSEEHRFLSLLQKYKFSSIAPRNFFFFFILFTVFTLTITPPAVAHLAPAAAHPAPDVLVDIPKEYTPTDADQATIPRIEKKMPWWRPTCDKMIFLTCGVLMAVGFAGFIVGLHRFFGNPKEHMGTQD